MKKLDDLQFQANFTEALPGDSSRDFHPRQVKNACYSFVSPTPVSSPKLIAWSDSLAAQFDLARPRDEASAAAILSGNTLLNGMQPFSACYGGHQFGNWAAQLGDGRAITLGDTLDPQRKSWEFQLKGAGITPYSRRGDGRAVLRSSIREFICSEAMFHLGVPTTRALSLVLTGDMVERDMFYNGNPRSEAGAIVCRVSESFIRFGNFEILAARGEVENLHKLLQFTIKNYYSDINQTGQNAYLELFREITRRTALLMAHWMRVGFVHGVMNTDNMSILGVTIDYGPYGWLENYDPSWTPNTTDLPGRRYSFGRQPSIALWNLLRLAEAIAVVLPDQTKELEAILSEYQGVYEQYFLEMQAAKLGLSKVAPESLLELYSLMQTNNMDLTLFFRGLSQWDHSLGTNSLPNFLIASSYEENFSAEQGEAWQAWLKKYMEIVAAENLPPEQRRQKMERANPLYVPRNYLLQEAIELAEQGDYSKVEILLQLFQNPYTKQEGKEAFALKRPEWARNKPGSSTLSCSS